MKYQLQDNLLGGIEEALLMGPGPPCAPESVYEALRVKTLGHLDPYFLKIMDEIKELLRRIMNTRNAVSFPVSGTGSACMEDVARRLGANVDVLEFPWGSPVVPEAVEKR